MTSSDATTKALNDFAQGVKISIVDLVNNIVEKAEECHASDIHIDPTPKETSVRMRIDGVLKLIYSLPKNIHPEIIARIKVLSKLRSDDHQTTQDGRFRYHRKSTEGFVDIQASIIPKTVLSYM